MDPSFSESNGHQKPERGLDFSALPGLTREARHVSCRACDRVIDEGDTYCRHCGRRQDQSAAWYYQPLWILVLALLAIGPLALPLVWRSPRMSRTEKTAFTTAILLYTAMLAWGLYRAAELAVEIMRQLSEASFT